MRRAATLLRFAASCAVLFTLAPDAVTSAHEIGTTRVAVRFAPEGVFRIEIVTDAVLLLARLELAAGEPRSNTEAPDALQERLVARAQRLREHFAAEFDGVAAHPEIHIEVAPAIDAYSAPAATIRLAGTRPPGSRQFTWTYALTSASYALSVHSGDERAPATQWVEGNSRSTAIALDAVQDAATGLDLAIDYVVLGFTHIVPGGIDHVLFVLGIFLLSRRVRPVLMQITAFTVAHSITLGLSIYGIVSLPSSIVEPLIAASIAYIAIENVVVRDVKPSRVWLVFAFGLLHGLGFAGALREVGLPRSEFLTALLAFNVGVELGQLAVIGAAFVLVGYRFGGRSWYRRRVVLPASACMACFGVVWTLQRLHLI